MSNCSSCKTEVHHSSLGKYCVRFGSDIKQFCSNVCLEDYKKGLKVRSQLLFFGDRDVLFIFIPGLLLLSERHFGRRGIFGSHR